MAKFVNILVNGKSMRMTERAAQMAIRYYGGVIIDEKKISEPTPLIQPPKVLVPEAPVIIEAKVKKSGEMVMRETPVVKTVKKKRNVSTNKPKNK